MCVKERDTETERQRKTEGERGSHSRVFLCLALGVEWLSVYYLSTSLCDCVCEFVSVCLLASLCLALPLSLCGMRGGGHLSGHTGMSPALSSASWYP